MKITIHEEKNSHFTFHGEKKAPITSHENTLYHPRISVCLFCPLETISLNEFLISFISGYLCVDILYVKCLGNFSLRFFWPPRFWDLKNLGEILLEILPRFSASFLLPRFWDLAEILVRISARISASFWPPKCWDLAEILTKIYGIVQK